MAKEITPSREYDSLLYDADTGESCITERIVDITEDCPRIDEGRKALLFFTRVSQGRVVQILHTFSGRKNDGAFVHFFINRIELTEDSAETPRRQVFHETAKKFGLTETRLYELIMEHVPA